MHSDATRGFPSYSPNLTITCFASAQCKRRISDDFPFLRIATNFLLGPDVSFRCCGRLLHPGTECHWMRLLLMQRQFGGATHAKAVTTIGLDIAKSVFQVHGVDANGQVVIRRQLKRRYILAFFQKLPPCLVGIEACASSHHWSRELQALGHTVRLMPPAYVKPYVKRHKNDATDAEAICEAVSRPNMRFVATKTPGQQSCLTPHRTRHLFIRQQTSVINAIRAHLAEFGIVAPVGRHGVEQLLQVVADKSDKRLPEVARKCVAALGANCRR